MIGKQGYSLPVQIAAIVVTVILLCVAADAVHVLRVRQIREGRSAVCLSNIKQIALGLKTYMDDWDKAPPTSRVIDPHSAGPDVRYCCNIGYCGDADRAWQTAASLLIPYGVNSCDCYFCPSESSITGSPTQRVSYIYRPALDVAASHGLRESDFQCPATQVVFFDRLDFHSSQSPRGWVEGARFNVAFMDGHVASVSAAPGTSSGVGVGQITSSSNAVLKKAMDAPGWPCWFNFDTKTGKAIKGKAWDPRRYTDAVE